MATYTPLPFVATPLDQSAQNLRLVDLLYQAQLDRIQREQNARLQGAQMWTALGSQLPQIALSIEENRIREMQAAARQQEAETERRFREAQIAEWNADREERVRLAAERATQAQAQRDRELEMDARDTATAVYGMTAPGAISQGTLEQLNVAPQYQGLLKYEFGPGTAEGPRLMEDPMRQAARLKDEQARAASEAKQAEEANKTTQLLTLAELASNPNATFAQRQEAANYARVLGATVTPLPPPEPVKAPEPKPIPPAFGSTPEEQQLIAAVEQDTTLLDKLSPTTRESVLAALGPERLAGAKSELAYPQIESELRLVTQLLGDKSGREALLRAGAQNAIAMELFGRSTGAADYKAAFDALKAGQIFSGDFLSKLRGQLSDKDIEVVRQAANTLSLGQSPEAQERELRRIYDMLSKAKAAADTRRAMRPQSSNMPAVDLNVRRQSLGAYPR